MGFETFWVGYWEEDQGDLWAGVCEVGCRPKDLHSRGIQVGFKVTPFSLSGETVFIRALNTQDSPCSVLRTFPLSISSSLHLPPTSHSFFLFKTKKKKKKSIMRSFLPWVHPYLTWNIFCTSSPAGAVLWTWALTSLLCPLFVWGWRKQ